MEEQREKRTALIRRVIFGIRFLEMRLRFVMVLVLTALIVGYWSDIENHL